MIDWEVCQLYRNLRDEGNSLPEIKSKIRDKFLNTLCGKDRDTYFFVGNQWKHPRGFLVLGIFWPPKRAYRSDGQPTLPFGEP